MRRLGAVVTGYGMTTPLGGDAGTTWRAMVDGVPGVHVIKDDWAADLPVRIAAQAAVDPGTVLSRVETRRHDRAGQLALVAAREAWARAGFVHAAGPRAAEEPSGEPAAGVPDQRRVAVVIASGIGGILTILQEYEGFLAHGWSHIAPFTVVKTMPNSPAISVSLDLHARAGAFGTVSACASSADALAQGLSLIREGRADVVVAGGTEAAIHPYPIGAFAAMRALSTRNDEPEQASRPFDVDRDGFVLGEGAAVLVLEAAAHAVARGATAYAELAGFGYSSDAYNVVQPDPAGQGAALAIRHALDDAAAEPSDVVHINAHATSTPVGDTAEAAAITAALGPAARTVPVTSTKSMTGHLLGAAGAMEAIATVLALHDRVAPPTINLEHLDPAVPLDVVGEERRPLDVDRPGAGRGIALSNSFGFGGHNVTLAFRRTAERTADGG